MYRIVKENTEGVVEEKVYGVLIDFDLASRTQHLAKDYTRTSQQRTGTPPYMAYGLLNGSDGRHLYRHDLESLFYIMLIVATHYEIQLPTGGKSGGLRTRQGFKELPYELWFNQPSYKTLASFKATLITTRTGFDLSPSFKNFRGWLMSLRHSFWRGFRYKQDQDCDFELAQSREEGEGSEGQGMPTFDEETLGGHINYSALINPVRELKGELEGLIIRYDRPPLT